MPNIITIGTIATPNPALYLDLATVGTTNVQFRIQSALPTPPGEWMYHSQFCSLLSIAWLNNSKRPAKFSIADFSDQDKKTMAEDLITISGGAQGDTAQAQVNDAVGKIHGIAKTPATFVAEFSKYPVGTKIWTGNNNHVLGIYIVDATTMAVYDSNTGVVTPQPRTNILQLINQNQLNAFVVTQV